ncbi:MAG: segregation/condensation protein A [Planctomycetota bacterium]
MTAQPEYKVSLEHFSGPLDLLLYLIRKEEVDIYDIPITRLLDQYLVYLEMLQHVDLDAAGDFAVMASTLMVIKSKMLLPVEEVDLEEELDPRYELVQQLLEYKRIRERARTLDARADAARRRLGRPETARPEPRVEEDRTLDELSIWDLFRFFQKIMDETTIDARKERVIEGKHIPVRDFAVRLEERILRGPLRLSQLFAETRDRSERIGYFLALLLLMKTQVVQARQVEEFGDIEIAPKAVEESDLAAAQQELELADEFKD